MLKGKFKGFLYSVLGFDLCNSNGGAGVRRLHEYRVTELFGDFLCGFSGAAAAEKGEPLHLRHAGVFKNGVADLFVHANGGGEHLAADVGDSGNFKKPLHRSVLAVLAVEHRENDVNAPLAPLAVFLDHNSVDGAVGTDICFFKIFFVESPLAASHLFDVAAVKAPFAVFRNSD